MKKLILLLCTFSALIINAQSITVDNIWKGKYYPQSLYGINSMNDGEHYSIQEQDGIYRYAYQSFIDNQNSKELIVSGTFDEYKFSPDEKNILVLSESTPIYRRSVKGKWQVYSREKQSFQMIFDGKPIQEPTFSPDATKVAFAFENNLYYQDLTNNRVTQITNDGKKNEIINGICDWVYEEEFGFVRHFDWNADGTAIAFVKFDESKVREFYIPVYGQNLYPEEMRFKYPKAGEENSKVSLYIFDLKSNKSEKISLSSVENYYIPKIKFTKDKNILSVLTSNRHQNKVDVNFVEINSKKLSKLFSETDKAWIETDNFTLEFLNDNSFLWASERDGNRHFYHYDKYGKLINQITKGDWEVTDYYGFDASDKTVYYQSNAFDNKRNSIERQVYKINLDGKNNLMLTERKGENSAEFSKNFKYFILNFSSVDEPPLFQLNDGKKPHEYNTILKNTDVKNRLMADGAGTKEFFTVKTEIGVELNAWMIKPKDFDPNKKYPLLMYQYSGPGSQEVTNSWHSMNDQWYLALAQKGYIVACVDGRGTGGKGAAFKKQTYLNLGRMEVEDQISAARVFAKYDYIDAARIGIWGWSYGGFMASNCIFRGGDVFKMAIAVAPVTNWRYYDTVYTERFLRTPQENPKGYDENSPMTYANRFDDKNDKFLLVHGTADDNVHFQNSMELSESLIQADKQFEMMIYPDKNHGIYGGKTRIQLYTLMTNYILENL